MSKPKSNRDDEPRPINFVIGDDPLPTNNTFRDLIDDGEKHKSSKRGQLGDRIGAALQSYYAEQTRVANATRGAVSGEFTITIKSSDGPDGSHIVAVDVKSKTARVPAGTFIVLADEDGEPTDRPMRADRDEPLTDYINDKAKTKAEPKAGAASNL